VREASELFSDNLLQNVAVERQVDDDDLFQLAILIAQRSQLTQLPDAKPCEPLLPPVERLLANPQPSAHFGDLLAGLNLAERVDDLFVAPQQCEAA
jgi:hypothetical protein